MTEERDLLPHEASGSAPRDIEVSEPSPLRTAERIYLELCTLVREALKRRRGPEGLGRKTQLEIKLKLVPFEDPASPGEAPAERKFAEALLDGIGAAIEREVERVAPFPEGRVRCFWCNSFDCAHSVPAGAHTIFGGYSPTGLPTWPDLAAVALERRDPRIDDLYREVPIPITIVQTGESLVTEQLPVYGRGSGVYRILGQVAVGYLSLPAGPRGDRATVALTLQAVEVHRGKPQVLLNALGRLPDGTDLGRFLEEEPDSRLADALRAARLRLDEIGQRSRRRCGQPRERQAMAVLERLARNLDRIFRQETRRTKHARERHLDRDRPAAAALRDAMAARSDEILRDVRESTWVVLGPKSRVHFFNDAGKHVTSVVYPGDTVRRRTAQGMWRAAPAESVRGFREAVERTAEAGRRPV